MKPIYSRFDLYMFTGMWEPYQYDANFVFDNGVFRAYRDIYRPIQRTMIYYFTSPVDQPQ